jgi:hypothetical protein
MKTRRHVVERHLADKHPEKRPFVKVIREMQPDQAGESQQQQSSVSQEPEETELPDPDGNTWKCNLCDFKSVYKTAMQNHAAITHDEKCQFKCNGCTFKTISKITFDQHMLTKHINEPEVDYTTVYQRIKGARLLPYIITLLFKLACLIMSQLFVLPSVRHHRWW